MMKCFLPPLATLLILCAFVSLAAGDEALDGLDIMITADIENGKSIFLTGKRNKGAHLAFTGGPNWLHTDEGGCADCHGTRGWGSSIPRSCDTKTPPITFKYLAGDGYSLSARESKRHPVYTLYSFKLMMREGVKSNGYEADFCMPRYRISNEELRDLLGYLIVLDK